MSKKKSNSDTFPNFKDLWKGSNNNIWLATNLKLYRNLSNFHFPGKLAIEGRKQVLEIIKSAFLQDTSLKLPKLYHAEETTPIQKEYLYEHFFSIHGFHQAHAGEAFVTDENEDFLGILNIRDHLQLQILDTNGEIEKTWNRILKIEAALGSTLKFAYKETYGFLTSNPALCGTGFVILGFLQLPALIHTGALLKILTQHRTEGIESTGLQGDTNNFVGDVLVLYNNYTLGITEESIATTMRSAIMRIFVEEKSAREKIREENNDHIKDLVSRSYGLLMHSYQIETPETLSAISLCKLGVDLEWIKGTNHGELNNLFLNCRRGHLLINEEEKDDPEKVLHLRAEQIHKVLANTTLVI